MVKNRLYGFFVQCRGVKPRLCEARAGEFLKLILSGLRFEDFASYKLLLYKIEKASVYAYSHKLKRSFYETEIRLVFNQTVNVSKRQVVDSKKLNG